MLESIPAVVWLLSSQTILAGLCIDFAAHRRAKNRPGLLLLSRILVMLAASVATLSAALLKEEKSFTVALLGAGMLAVSGGAATKAYQRPCSWWLFIGGKLAAALALALMARPSLWSLAAFAPCACVAAWQLRQSRERLGKRVPRAALSAASGCLAFAFSLNPALGAHWPLASLGVLALLVSDSIAFEERYGKHSHRQYVAMLCACYLGYGLLSAFALLHEHIGI